MARQEAHATLMRAIHQQRWEGVAAESVLRRLGEPHEIADGVAWLCSERASFFTGIVLDINGGTAMR